MKNLSRFLVVTVFWALVIHAADSAHMTVHGSITHLDTAAKTVVVKTKQGSELTLHFVEGTVVRGADKTASGSKSEFKGLSEGSEVIVHYSESTGQNNAYEFDKVGKDGVKYVDGTVTKVGKDGKTMVVKAADGTEHTFDVVGNDTVDAAKKIGKSAKK